MRIDGFFILDTTADDETVVLRVDSTTGATEWFPDAKTPPQSED